MQVVFLLWPKNHQLPHVDGWLERAVALTGNKSWSSKAGATMCPPKPTCLEGFYGKSMNITCFLDGHRSCLVKPSKNHARRPCALGATTATLVAGWCETYGGQIGKIYRDVLENSYPDTQWDWSIHLLAFRWWFEIFFIFTPYFGKWYSLTSIFFRWVETTK